MPPRLVADIWPLCSAMIERACRHDDLSDFPLIERQVLGGDYLLWAAWDADRALGAWVTQISEANGRRYCTIVACGGHQLSRWRHLIASVEDHARQHGCAGIRIIGRKGWLRALDGFRQRAVVLEKEL